jgi:hypothetical protein
MQKKHESISGTDASDNHFRVTVVMVNWYLARDIHHLIQNLDNKAAEPGTVRYLIVDNTSGDDEKLTSLTDGISNLKIIYPQAVNLRGSRAHAHALDIAVPRVHTDFTLVVDPDVHVFAGEWDQKMIRAVESCSAIAAGAPYPFWKLGKYHDFPSPVFMFFRTRDLLALDRPWTPFATQPLRYVYYFCARQVVRMGLLATRRRLICNKTMLSVGQRLESILGICGPDTGWLLADAARKEKMPVSLFTEMTPVSPLLETFADPEPLLNLIEQFECYEFQGELFMTHKYGTLSPLWKTARGRDSDYWYRLIHHLETSYGC